MEKTLVKKIEEDSNDNICVIFNEKTHTKYFHKQSLSLHRTLMLSNPLFLTDDVSVQHSSSKRLPWAHHVTSDQG